MSVKNTDVMPYIRAQLTPDMKTLFDVGCGRPYLGFGAEEDMLLSLFEGWGIKAIDAWPEAIEWRKENGPPGEYWCADGADIEVPKSDVCMIHHVIEHMPKDAGLQLLEKLEAASKKLTIVGAPDGWFGDHVDIAHKTGNIHNQHLSTWTSDEMRERGYEVHQIEHVFIAFRKW
jgi:hypothetical protein